MDSFEVRSLAIPAVLLLISFLSFSSQYLFIYLDPWPLSRRQTIIFNINIGSVLVSYARAVLTDPGRFEQRGNRAEEPESNTGRENDRPDAAPKVSIVSRQRWCRVCENRKPPRSHHCRVCKRCIPKMDHHCPWTYNCVSHRTFPHFMKFVFYSVTAMIILEYHIWVRGAHLWSLRDYPMHHGPSAIQLAHLFVLAITNSFALFMLSILLVRSIWNLMWNVTTIEEWEIERHETLLRRAKASGGLLYGPDGIEVRITRQEFPYDIGIWKNVVQGMGTRNILAWFSPFSSTPSLESGMVYETNGFEDPTIGWPPPDPDRIPRMARHYEAQSMEDDFENESPTTRRAFRERQAADLKRWNNVNDWSRAPNHGTNYSLTVPPTSDQYVQDVSELYTPSPSPTPFVRRRQPFHKRFDNRAVINNDASRQHMYVNGNEVGEESWKNEDGDGLKDFGLDEQAEFYDEEDIPLTELLRLRRAQAQAT